MSGLDVLLVHPELVRGGAERLMVDAAIGLQERGHRVRILTAGHDPAGSFPETRDGTLAVQVAEAWLPRAVAGRLVAPCAIARMLALARAAGHLPRPDVVFVSQVPHAVPALRRATGAPVAFYGHFPDALLAPRRDGWRGPYRRAIEALEERGIRAADRFFVNSRFTAAAFARRFPALPPARVVYPGIDPGRFGAREPGGDERWLVSIQRFDPGKNLALAIETLARVPPPARLALVGQLDARRPEAVALRRELAALAERRGVSERVRFVENPDDAALGEWLRRASVVLYTPVEEHFGLVPLEAMAAGVPVVACRGGGPLETIEHGVSGLLVAPDPISMAEAIFGVFSGDELAGRLIDGGRLQASLFTRARFAEALESELVSVAAHAEKIDRSTFR